MVQTAKTLGTPVASFSIAEAPWYFVEALSKATQVLSWFENLPEEDIPPENIWHHAERLKEHFDRVKAKHKSSSGAADDGLVEIDNSEIEEYFRS